jgi:hypothetical protein
MATMAQRLAELERQVADLAAEVRDLRTQAFTWRTYEEMRLERMERLAGAPAAVPPRRLRHLQAVQEAGNEHGPRRRCDDGSLSH